VHIKTENLFPLPCLPWHQDSSVVANMSYVLSSVFCKRKFVITRTTLNRRDPRIFHWGGSEAETIYNLYLILKTVF
jgi:hypothetical protein